jgi:hypothetical protein
MEDSRDVLFHPSAHTCEVRVTSEAGRSWLREILPHVTVDSVFIPTAQLDVFKHSATVAGLNCGMKLGY